MKSTETVCFTDHLPLMELTDQILSSHENLFSSNPYDGGAEAKRLGYIKDSTSKRKPCLVMARETAVEFGSPAHISVPMLLWTRENRFRENRIWCLTRDFDSFQTGPVSFLMAVMVSIDESFDPTGPGFKNLLNLSNRIQGYMSRTVPGKMWVRISHNLMKKNFSLYSLGQCIAYSFLESIPAIKGMEIILAADNDKLIKKFDDIKNRADIISGKNRKLALEKDGTLSCEDLDCRSCEYKTECDTIRDIISKRKEL